MGSFCSALETRKQGVHRGEQRPVVYVNRVQRFLLKTSQDFAREMDRLWDNAELGITPHLQRKLDRHASAAEMERRGDEKAERKGEWLEKWLRDYAGMA